MQVHAVPESERFVDSNGNRLPWAYESADPDRSTRRVPQESGPFGRSTRRRAHSRSKTATPSRKEDKDTLENWNAINDIFARVKNSEEIGVSSGPGVSSKDTAAAPSSWARSTGPGETAAEPAAPAQNAPGQPTEVMLYGFPSHLQYAAIDFFERVSGGAVYEDYERNPPHSRYNLALSHSARRSGPIPPAALAKKNAFAGGAHWIKVTFDSPEAAGAACHYSPRVISGYLVHAEMYRCHPPVVGDIVLPATEEAVRSATASPDRRSDTLRPTVSDTVSSATATATQATAEPEDPFVTSTPLPARKPSLHVHRSRTPGTPAMSTGMSSGTALRIRGAKRAVLLPAEQALLPAPSRWQRTVGAWPLVGLLFGGAGEVIGSQVPRTETGEFDWVAAGWYWWFWACVDYWLGTGFCGLGGED
ncbi:hypothetical protein EJ06DRAFT_470641 [Trichodelitschia bisporula]|uniref:RRM Nup35-type domain-containing protein n=1 Tax=Trichodelitschia bisporula TaxID=703511 RepID=A0A6G1I8L0_9PEZI|nr:hypothetical protein EJ06DRAFT_470641 [Trichodelitschia bisporula]